MFITSVWVVFSFIWWFEKDTWIVREGEIYVIYDSWFTDKFSEESSELSSEPESSTTNFAQFTRYFKSFLAKWTKVDIFTLLKI